MADTSRPRPTMTFAEMDLRVGQPLQLLIQGALPSKHYTRLIGYADPEFMMVKVPLDKGRPVPFLDGQLLQVRLFSGRSLFQFDSPVLAQLQIPRQTLLLGVAQSVQETRMRAHVRVKTQLPLRVLQAPGVAADSPGFRFEDLSGGGAAVVGPHPLGQAGDAVRLAWSFHLAATGEDETVEMAGRIRTLGPAGPSGPAAQQLLHGIEFDTTDPRTLLLIYELQNSRGGASVA